MRVKNEKEQSVFCTQHLHVRNIDDYLNADAFSYQKQRFDYVVYASATLPHRPPPLPPGILSLAS